jgi:hypothetical protein
MPKCKPGFIRVCADIPEARYAILRKFNAKSPRPIVVKRVIVNAIENEINKIENEMY